VDHRELPREGWFKEAAGGPGPEPLADRAAVRLDPPRYYPGKKDHHKRVTTERPHPMGGSCPREGHGKGMLITDSLFRAFRWIPWLISDPPGAAIGCCWTESAVRICADLDFPSESAGTGLTSLKRKQRAFEAGARPGSTPPWNQGDPPCSFPPWPPGPRQEWAAGSDRFWLRELRVSHTFPYNLRSICSGHGYPAGRAESTA